MFVATHLSGLPFGGPWLFLASERLGSVPTSAPLAFDRTFREAVSIYGAGLTRCACLLLPNPNVGPHSAPPPPLRPTGKLLKATHPVLLAGTGWVALRSILEPQALLLRCLHTPHPLRGSPKHPGPMQGPSVRLCGFSTLHLLPLPISLPQRPVSGSWRLP